MKGFTLIELMVVIAIIGILAAVAIPIFTGTSNQPYCKSGYEFDRASGRQIIGANGGGVPCQTVPQ